MLDSTYDRGKSGRGHGRSFQPNFQREEKGKGEREKKENKQSEETGYKILMTGLVISNANAGCVLARVTHWFFY